MKSSPLLVAVLLTAVASSADTSATPDVQRLPDTTVEGALQEEMPVGPYNQPEWTTARRFPTTRVYLQQQPWGFGAEQWVKAQYNRDEGPTYTFQEEIEMGLPYRFQADVYEICKRNDKGTIYHDAVSTELRWAVADWGVIPLNPTLYGEWVFRDSDRGPDKWELKMLLGQDLAPRVHFGANLLWEQEVGDGRAIEVGATAGLSYTIVDEKFSAGIEIKVESETEKGDRSNAPVEVDFGPSFQWRPTKNTHFDVAPLFGLTSDSPRVEAWIIFGVDFGPGNSQTVHAPVSMRSQ